LSESFDRPFLLDHLHWTSREDVAAKLVALAHTGDPSTALRATFALGGIATSALAPHLVVLAIRRELPLGVRGVALAMLARLGAQLPDADLDALLDEQPHAPREGGEAPHLGFVVALAQTDAQRARVLAFLDDAGRDVRASLLLHTVKDATLRASLVSRWRAEVDIDNPSSWDREIARVVARDLAVPVMLGYWRRSGLPRRPRFWSDIRDCPELITLLPSEDLRVDAAEGLKLNLGQELELLGAGGLRRVLRRVVHERSFALRCPVAPWDDAYERLYQRALEFLKAWPEGARIALGLLTGAVLHAEVRKDLVRILWRVRRAWGRRWIAPRVRDPEAIDEVRAAAEVARDAPSPEDRDVLCAMLAVSDERVRCAAIAALDAIAAVDPASARDEGLADILSSIASRPKSRARLAALLSLVRRGHRRFFAGLRDACASRDPEERWLAIEAIGRLAQDEEVGAACTLELEAAATGDFSIHARAEAVGRLALLPDPGAHVGTFENVLASSPKGLLADDVLYGNAVVALGAVGTGRALTALLRAAFQVNATCLWSVSDALRVALDHRDASPRERLAALWEAGWFFWSASPELALHEPPRGG
jgi:HEAT repeat protein